MLKNYLKITLRNLRRQKGYTFINISGLAVGLTCCILILMYVQFELSFDNFHENADNIVRIRRYLDIEDASSQPFPVAPAMQTEMPHIKFVRFFRLFQHIPAVSYEEKVFFEHGFMFADSSVFDVFTFPFVKGNPKTALVAPNTVVLTEEMAQKYFGDEDPMGKTLSIDKKIDFTVTGIMKNIPENTHFQFDFLGTFQGIKETLVATGTRESWYTSWYWNPCWTYAMLPDGHTAERFESELDAFAVKFFQRRIDNNDFKYYTQPLRSIHLNSNLYNEIKPNGNRTVVYIFLVIALFVLLIACINFMNLSTARSINRSKEVGVRKVLGAVRGQLVKQFLGESIIMALIAMFLAVGLTEIFLPAFNNLVGKELSVNYHSNFVFSLGLLSFTLLVGVLSGFYPAFLLSSFKPLSVIKGAWEPGSAKNVLQMVMRKGLVIFQFAISIILIIGTIVVNGQLDFIRNKNMGFEKEETLYIPYRGTEAKRRSESFKTQLLQSAEITHAAGTSDAFGKLIEIRPFTGETDNGPKAVNMPGIFVDHDFISTLGLVLTAGRDYSREIATDFPHGYIVNEAAQKLFGWQDPIGKRFSFGGQLGEGTIIGVVKDFNYATLHEKIQPLVLLIRPNWFDYVAVRVNMSNLNATIEHMENVWHSFVPNRPFEFFFLDENIDKQYKFEQTMGQVFNYFSAFAIIIACLGLFGLVSYTAEQKTREIGIRKVLGATSKQIVYLLSKDFTKLVIIANLFAWPLAYYSMNRWLQGFAYRIDISLAIFFLSTGIALLISILTVSYQSLKSALLNPVDTLKDE